MTRRVIVVDCETNGLDPAVHVPTEVAAIDLATGEVIADFCPWVGREHIAAAEYEALAVSRYFERRLWERQLNPDDTEDRTARLFDQLDGVTLAGCNPRFDAAMLRRGHQLTSLVDLGEPWHHRLLDVSAYAAGVLGLPLGELPGLDRVAELCGVEVDPAKRHTALGDAEVTARCFIALQRRDRVNTVRDVERGAR